MTAAAPSEVERVTRTFPVVEVFGPTIQGEGPDAGRRAFFVRLGGCDYRCSWCDSMHAVLPGLVREAPKLTAKDIGWHLTHLGAGPGDLIVLSGGNPALHHGTALVDLLHDLLLRVSIETQGSVWRDWLANVDRLVVSPKPPSSGESSDHADDRVLAFLNRAYLAGVQPAVKIVVFDDVDYEWALAFITRISPYPTWVGLSCGTGLQEPLVETAKRYRWLCEKAAKDRTGLVCMPQLHVIAWGHELGR